MEKNFNKIILTVILILLCGLALFACSNDPKEADYSITVLPCENGSVVLENPSVTPMNTAHVTITPDKGYNYKEGSLRISPFNSYNISENTASFWMTEHHVTIFAEFEEITRTFTYDYQDATNNNSIENITLRYQSVGQSSFVVPKRENCVFDGWYLGDDSFGFFEKVSDENGSLLIGTELFDYPFTTLFARWIAATTPVYPILMVYVNEVKGSFKMLDGTIIDIDYKLNETEKQICKMITEHIWGSLSFIFNGLVEFKIDNYFTSIPVGEEMFSVEISPKDGKPCREYMLFAENIPEVGSLVKEYRSVITTACLGDFDGILRNFGGIATNKYAYIQLEPFYTGKFNNSVPIYELFDFNKQEVRVKWEFIRNLYLHEFTHTVEVSLNYLETKVHEYHDVIREYASINQWDLKVTRLYLLHEAEANGKSVGIPFSYWTGEIDVIVHYIALEGGVTAPAGENISNPSDWGNNTVLLLPFGADTAVEAIPLEGYRFVKWSDGVVTAVRYDANIISYILVYAIFEKID